MHIIKIMLGYINTHSCYFLSPSIDASITFYTSRYNRERPHRDTIIHFIDSNSYTLGNYYAYYYLAVNYSGDKSIQEKLMSKLGNEYMDLMLDVIEECGDPIVHEQLCEIATKHYTLDIDNYKRYLHLAPYLPYDAYDYDVDEYLYITDKSARWFLERGVVDHVIACTCEYLSVDVLEEIMDFIVLNPNNVDFHIDSFVDMCKYRGCNFTGREAIYKYMYN